MGYSRRGFTLAGVAAALDGNIRRASAAPATANEFPLRPVQLLVPFPPGGATDTQARALSHGLGQLWRRPVVVDNRPGGNTLIATEIVARAQPDGHTLALTAMPFTLNPIFYNRMPYDTDRDISPVSLVSQVPLVLVVNTSVPVRTLAELISLAKARPRELFYASSGTGATTHLAGEMLCSMAGIELVHVPYRGGAQVHADLLAGRIPMVFDTGAWSLIAAGQVRPIAVTTTSRLASLPQVPTVAESGYPNFSITAWHGIIATGGTPEPVVAQVASGISQALQMPDVAARFDALSAQRVSTSPQEFRAFLASERERFTALIRERNITLDT
jgi:tripartite-type tricarboxylate transporter receptor subunit TctC